jgi:hypothetical protein
MKVSLYQSISIILLVLFVAGCQTQQTAGPEVIKPEDVKIFMNSPGNYVLKGTVTATSKPKMTTQEAQDYFIQELTRQAASLGANGLLVLDYTGRGPSETVDVNRGGRYIPVPAHTTTVKAQAIYIRRKN